MNTVMSHLVPSTTMNFLRNAQAIYGYLKNDFTMLIRRGWSSEDSLLEKIFSFPPPITSDADVLIRRLRTEAGAVYKQAIAELRPGHITQQG
jgi:hypothetical protein